MHQFDAHVFIDEDRDLLGVAVAGKIFCQQTQRRDQLAGPLECVFTADDVDFFVDFLPDPFSLWADIADER